MHRTIAALPLLLLLLPLGCPTADPAIGEGEGEGEGEADLGSFFEDVVGLWRGPATQTPLGDYPVMMMDLRAADDRSLFARADLDDDNALRFAFDVEDLDGIPTLVFRNGGFFQGILRDSRTRLVERNGSAWRFCSVERGCGYIDATWTVGGDELRLDATVLGVIHVVWDAQRDEARPLPATFGAVVGADDLDLPVLSQLTTTITFPAVAADADAWVFLSTGNCGQTFSCNVARSKRVAVAAGDTSAVVVIDQLHPGDYVVNVLLDRNRNFETALRPDTGDGVAAPDSGVTIDDTASTTAPIVFTL